MGWNENIAATVTHVRGDRPTLDLVPDHHIAQINIGVMIAPTDDPSVAEFMENLDHINAQADAAEGFVWRLQSEQGNATDIQIFPNPLELVNMSVWESVDTLKSYVYRTEHVEFFRRRAAWFEADGKRVALWSVRPGRIPTLADAVRRVEFMEHHGPTPYAFGFAQPPPALVFETVGGLRQRLSSARLNTPPRRDRTGSSKPDTTGESSAPEPSARSAPPPARSSAWTSTTR